MTAAGVFPAAVAVSQMRAEFLSYDQFEVNLDLERVLSSRNDERELLSTRGLSR